MMKSRVNNIAVNELRSARCVEEVLVVMMMVSGGRERM